MVDYKLQHESPYVAFESQVIFLQISGSWTYNVKIRMERDSSRGET